MSVFRYPRPGETFELVETDTGTLRFRSLDEQAPDMDLFIEHQTKLQAVDGGTDAVCIYLRGVNSLTLWVKATCHSLQEMVGRKFMLERCINSGSSEPELDLCPPWRDKEAGLYRDEVGKDLLRREFVGDNPLNDNYRAPTGPTFAS